MITNVEDLEFSFISITFNLQIRKLNFIFCGKFSRYSILKFSEQICKIFISRKVKLNTNYSRNLVDYNSEADIAVWNYNLSKFPCSLLCRRLLADFNCFYFHLISPDKRGRGKLNFHITRGLIERSQPSKRDRKTQGNGKFAISIWINYQLLSVSRVKTKK